MYLPFVFLYVHSFHVYMTYKMLNVPMPHVLQCPVYVFCNKDVLKNVKKTNKQKLTICSITVSIRRAGRRGWKGGEEGGGWAGRGGGGGWAGRTYIRTDYFSPSPFSLTCLIRFAASPSPSCGLCVSAAVVLNVLSTRVPSEFTRYSCR